MNINAVQFNQGAVDDITSEAIKNGRLQVMPSSFYARFSQSDIAAFCVKQGLYCLPTTELLDRLNSWISFFSPSRNAIEIGAGEGAIGRGLGIVSTDSMMQSDPAVAQLYALLRQPVVNYGPNVQRLDANAAVETLRPDVVIGAWVTHKFVQSQAERDGNMFGIDEEKIVDQVQAYIVVGHESVHGKKPIMELPHRTFKGDYLFSRSMSPAGQAVFVWTKTGRRIE